MKVPETFYRMTLQQVADELGISKQAVADTEKRALRKLREHQTGRLLKMRAMVRHLRRNRDAEVTRFHRSAAKGRA